MNPFAHILLDAAPYTPSELLADSGALPIVLTAAALVVAAVVAAVLIARANRGRKNDEANAGDNTDGKNNLT